MVKIVAGNDVKSFIQMAFCSYRPHCRERFRDWARGLRGLQHPVGGRPSHPIWFTTIGFLLAGLRILRRPVTAKIARRHYP